MPDIVSKLLRSAIWSHCAVWFFLWQVADLDLLLCTGINSEHAVLFLCHIFTQRPMNDLKIERSDGRCFGRQQLVANSMEISFHMKKKSVVTARYLLSIKTFLALNWVSIARVVARFPQASQSLPAATAGDLETPCVCPRLFYPANLCLSAAQELGHWFCSQILRLSSRIAFGSDCQMTGTGRQGLELGLKLELCRLSG